MRWSPLLKALAAPAAATAAATAPAAAAGNGVGEVCEGGEGIESSLRLDSYGGLTFGGRKNFMPLVTRPDQLKSRDPGGGARLLRAPGYTGSGCAVGVTLRGGFSMGWTIGAIGMCSSGMGIVIGRLDGEAGLAFGPTGPKCGLMYFGALVRGLDNSTSLLGLYGAAG